MTEMYVRLITQTDNWTLSRVPSKYRDAVWVELSTQGYDDNGNKVA